MASVTSFLFIFMGCYFEISEECFVNDQRGVCTSLSNCPQSVNLLLRGEANFCEFKEFLICCPRLHFLATGELLAKPPPPTPPTDRRGSLNKKYSHPHPPPPDGPRVPPSNGCRPSLNNRIVLNLTSNNQTVSPFMNFRPPSSPDDDFVPPPNNINFLSIINYRPPPPLPPADDFVLPPNHLRKHNKPPPPPEDDFVPPPNRLGKRNRPPPPPPADYDFVPPPNHLRKRNRPPPPPRPLPDDDDDDFLPPLNPLRNRNMPPPPPPPPPVDNDGDFLPPSYPFKNHNRPPPPPPPDDDDNDFLLSLNSPRNRNMPLPPPPPVDNNGDFIPPPNSFKNRNKPPPPLPADDDFVPPPNRLRKRNRPPPPPPRSAYDDFVPPPNHLRKRNRPPPPPPPLPDDDDNDFLPPPNPLRNRNNPPPLPPPPPPTVDDDDDFEPPPNNIRDTTSLNYQLFSPSNDQTVMSNEDVKFPAPRKNRRVPPNIDYRPPPPPSDRRNPHYNRFADPRNNQRAPQNKDYRPPPPPPPPEPYDDSKLPFNVEYRLHPSPVDEFKPAANDIFRRPPPPNGNKVPPNDHSLQPYVESTTLDLTPYYVNDDIEANSSSNLEPKKILMDTRISIKKCMEYYPYNGFRIFVKGGQKSLPKQYPHMALVGFGNESDKQWLCGGSLISLNFIMTAAHCVNSEEYGAARWIHLGDLDLSTDKDDAKPQEFKIKRTIVHPDFKYPLKYNDIALMELDMDVTRTAYVSPACLQTTKQINDTTMSAAGWGKTDFAGEASSFLMYLDLNEVASEKCKTSYEVSSALPYGIVGDMMICAGGEIGKDTCQGDSGGPLQVVNSYRTGATAVSTIVGITSFGKACGLTKSPGVYTRVSYYVNWIESIVWPEEYSKSGYRNVKSDTRNLKLSKIIN